MEVTNKDAALPLTGGFQQKSGSELIVDGAEVQNPYCVNNETEQNLVIQEINPGKFQQFFAAFFLIYYALCN